MFFKELDAFPKTLDEFRIRTHMGGLISLGGLTLIVLLVIWETWVYVGTNQAFEDVVIDNTMHESLGIHFDITFNGLKCSMIAIEAVDAAGGHQSMAKQKVFKLSLDPDNRAVGNSVRQDESDSTVLTHGELKKKKKEKQHEAQGNGEVIDLNEDDVDSNFFHSDPSCGSCYGTAEEIDSKKKCCNTCDQVKQAFIERGWEWGTSKKELERFWQCGSWNRPAQNLVESGCQVFGSIYVTKAKGSFHFGASEQVAGSDMLRLLFGIRTVHLDISHTINSLWFGDKHPQEAMKALRAIDSYATPGNPPLDKISKQIKDDSIVQYYVTVIATDVELLNGTVIESNQYAANEHIRPVQGSALPSLHIFYDTPPLRLRYVEKKKPWSHFLTNVCALAGGVFTIMGLVDQAIYSRAK